MYSTTFNKKNNTIVTRYSTVDWCELNWYHNDRTCMVVIGMDILACSDGYFFWIGFYELVYWEV